MRINIVKCDRCGFEKDHPSPHIQPAIIKLRRAGGEVATIDATTDWCEKCYCEVQAAITAAMVQP